MAKLIIFSVVLMTFIVPVRLSTAAQPRRSLRRAQMILLAFILVWVYLCLNWYPTLVPLK